MKKDSINIRFKNNSNVRVPVQILGGNSSTENASDKNTLVSWDLSNENFAQNVVILTTTPQFSAVLTEDAQNIAGVISALNSFKVATFYNSGTTVYASDLLNSTVATSSIDIDNEAWNIEGWEDQGNTGQSNYVSTLINAQWSADGGFIFMGDSVSSNQDKFNVTPTIWIPSDINAIVQSENPFTDYAWFGNNGLFRYTKAPFSSTWNRQSLGTAYDLTTIGAVDDTATNTGSNWIHWNILGTVVYGFTGSTVLSNHFQLHLPE